MLTLSQPGHGVHLSGVRIEGPWLWTSQGYALQQATDGLRTRRIALPKANSGNGPQEGEPRHSRKSRLLVTEWLREALDGRDGLAGLDACRSALGGRGPFSELRHEVAHSDAGTAYALRRQDQEGVRATLEGRKCGEAATSGQSVADQLVHLPVELVAFEASRSLEMERRDAGSVSWGPWPSPAPNQTLTPPQTLTTFAPSC